MESPLTTVQGWGERLDFFFEFDDLVVLDGLAGFEVFEADFGSFDFTGVAGDVDSRSNDSGLND